MSPLSDMPRRWRWLLIIGPYLALVIAAFVGFRQLEDESQQRCLNRQADRQVLRQVVDIATTPSSGGGSLDLTVVPGFSDLDEATQAFMRNLTVRLQSAPPASRNALHDELLAQLPPIDC